MKKLLALVLALAFAPLWAQTHMTVGNLNNVYYATQYPGSDVGVKANAAYSACVTAGITNCVIVISPGTWSYSTDIAFATPTTLRCDPNSILNYTGSGKALKMGPDGLTVSTYHVDPYQVDGCKFTGGASAAYGIYFNYYLTQTRVTNTFFSNFGNSTAWNIWYQGENWDGQIDHVNMWMTSSGGGMNGIAQNAGEPSTSDNGQSRLRITNSIIQTLSASGGVGVQLDGTNSQVLHTTIAGSFAPPLRLGAWSNKAIISDLNMEVDTSTFCIEFGDAAGSRIGNFLGELTIANNYCNVHNLDFSTTAQFMGPSVSGSTGSGLFNTRLINNTITNATPASTFVVLNNKASQTENEAWFNRIDGSFFNTSVSAFGTVHTSGGSISGWHGTDEIFYTYGSAQINGLLTVLGQNGSKIAQFQSNTDSGGGIWTSCGLTTRQNCGYFMQDNTQTEIGSLEWATVGGGGRSSWTNNSKAGVQQDSSGNLFTNFSVFGAGPAQFPSVTTVIFTPSAPTVTPTLGSATTWSYKVVAKDTNGAPTAASAAGTTTTGASTLDATHFNTITWTALQNAASYDIYRTAVGSSPSSTGKIGNVAAGVAATLKDTGLAGDSSSAPTVNVTGLLTPGNVAFTVASSHVNGSTANNDFMGTITLAGGSSGSYNFARAWTVAPNCIATANFDTTSSGIYWVTTSQTAVTINSKSAATGSYTYQCSGHDTF